MTERLRPWLAAACLALCACGGEPAPRPAQAAPEPVELVDGALHVHASAVPTLQLPASVARGYGIARGEHRVLLLVAMRRGAEGDETAVTGTVRVQATDLQGRVQPVAMRELRAAGGLVDYVGTVEVAPPDTLRFGIVATPRGERPRNLELVREFYP